MKKPAGIIHSYPWYVRDWRGSRTRLRLEPLGRYIFRELLDECHLEGSIPDDTRLLAKICDVPEREFLKHWPEVRAAFEPDGSGNLMNAKASQVVNDIRTWREQKANAGRSSGLSRRASAQQALNGRSNGNEQPFNETATAVEPSVAVAVAVADTVAVAVADKAAASAAWDGPDWQQECQRHAVRIIQRHPEPKGSLPYLTAALERALVSAVSPEAVLRDIEQAHIAQSAQQTRQPRKNWPTASRWVADGDYLKGAPRDAPQGNLSAKEAGW